MTFKLDEQKNVIEPQLPLLMAYSLDKIRTLRDKLRAEGHQGGFNYVVLGDGIVRYTDDELPD